MSKTIGFYMRDNKRKNFNWDEGFIPLAEKRGYKVEYCDASDESQKVDIVLAKLTDEFGSFQEEHSQQVIERFQRLEARNIPLVDPVEAQRVVSDREIFGQTLDGVQFDPLLVHNPKHCVAKSAENLEKSLEEHSVHFPVMMKPIVASGSLAAHEMGIYFNIEQLKERIQYPAFIQSLKEYFNHNATIFKVSVIGAYVHFGTKSSTKNFDVSYKEPVMFNSQHMQDVIDKESYKLEEPVSHESLVHIAKALSSSLGMHLYGFDIIRDNKTKKLAVIDVNFFPSFRAVPDVFDRFLDLFDILTNKQ